MTKTYEFNQSLKLQFLISMGIRIHNCVLKYVKECACAGNKDG